MLLDPNDKIRFQPNAEYAGDATITFRAWDQTSGTAENYGDADPNGERTAFGAGADTATITVTDAPTVQFTDATQSGPENGGALTATVQLSAESGQTITVSFSVDGASTAEGADYSISASPLTINPGELSADITATPQDDAFYEGDETVVINLDTPTNATLRATTTHTVNITDDEVQSFTGPTATGTGEATLSISGGTCALDPDNTALIYTEGLVLPQGVSFPDGAVRFRIVGCEAGATVEVMLILPSDLDGSAGWKLDETGAPFRIPGASVSGNTLIYSITDGGELDGDPTPGIIEEPVAVGRFADREVKAIPTWEEWARWLPAGLMLLLGWRMLGMRRSPQPARTSGSTRSMSCRPRQAFHLAAASTGGRVTPEPDEVDPRSFHAPARGAGFFANPRIISGFTVFLVLG